MGCKKQKKPEKKERTSTANKRAIERNEHACELTLREGGKKELYLDGPRRKGCPHLGNDTRLLTGEADLGHKKKGEESPYGKTRNQRKIHIQGKSLGQHLRKGIEGGGRRGLIVVGERGGLREGTAQKRKKHWAIKGRRLPRSPGSPDTLWGKR